MIRLLTNWSNNFKLFLSYISCLFLCFKIELRSFVHTIVCLKTGVVIIKNDNDLKDKVNLGEAKECLVQFIFVQTIYYLFHFVNFQFFFHWKHCRISTTSIIGSCGSKRCNQFISALLSSDPITGEEKHYYQI